MTYTISDFVVTSGASANGIDKNSINCRILKNGQIQSNLPVRLSLSGQTSHFSDNGLSDIIINSDALSVVSAEFCDIIAETVTVTATFVDDPSVNASGSSTFEDDNTEISKIELLLAVDNAKADGVDENLVEIQTAGDVNPVPDTQVEISLSNGAQFINGSSQTIITTNSAGRATLGFTNTNDGETVVTAYLPDNIAISNRVKAHFREVVPAVDLSLTTIVDGAHANGLARNQVQARVIHQNTLEPVPDMAVNFTVSGSAHFLNGTSTLTMATDANGLAYASLQDSVVETVTLSASAGAATATTALKFTSDYATLQITRAYNVNKNFDDAGPTVAWAGADLYVEAIGGSGDYTWSVISGSSGIILSDIREHTVHVLLNSGTQKFVTHSIQVKDNETDESQTFDFSLTTLFNQFGYWDTYDNSNYYPNTQTLLKLHSEWGSMRSYSRWMMGDAVHYWTDDHSYYYADAVNMVNGNVDSLNISRVSCGVARE